MIKLSVMDFETTGKDSKVCRTTEFGAARVDITHVPGNEVVKDWFDYDVKGYMNNLVYHPDYPALEQEVLDTCPHINDDVLKVSGISFYAAMTNLVLLFHAHGWPDYMLAHNSDYDEDVFRNEMRRHEAELKANFDDETLQRLWNLKWMCSIRDVQYPPRFTCKKLSHLAFDLGVNMQGRSLHKAIDDVLLVVDMLKAAQVNWITIIEQFNIPFVIVKAMIPPPFGKGNDGGVGKDACKLNKYKWQDIGDFNLPNSWLKKLKADQVELEESILGYPLRIVK